MHKKRQKSSKKIKRPNSVESHDFSVYTKSVKETIANRNKIKWLQLRSARQSPIS
jgi:translation initiation factor IF-3